MAWCFYSRIRCRANAAPWRVGGVTTWRPDRCTSDHCLPSQYTSALGGRQDRRVQSQRLCTYLRPSPRDFSQRAGAEEHEAIGCRTLACTGRGGSGLPGAGQTPSTAATNLAKFWLARITKPSERGRPVYRDNCQAPLLCKIVRRAAASNHNCRKHGHRPCEVLWLLLERTRLEWP